MTPDLLLPYAGTEPVFATPPLWCGRGSTVIGRASLGAEAWLGDDTVIRGDGHDIIAGDRLRLGPRATLHIAQDKYPCILGDHVTVGRNAVVHACTIGDDCVIEADCVVLDGSVVEDGVLIEAGSIVYPRSTLAAGFAYAGSPAEPTRRLAPGELAARAARLLGESPAAPAPLLEAGEARDATVFVARTARLRGPVDLAPGVSVFFACDLAAEAGPIAIGPNVNVQDNSVLRTEGSGLVIERDTTLGHNVRVADGQIGPRSLIGIGAVLAPGTVVGEDVLVAAGAWTEPGQVLESGWLWGGRPARRLGPLDAGKREMMRRIVQQYAGYGRTYRKAQAALLPPAG
ncbi:gamma carbonic anhydrase family protein [Methylobacterium nodulans]|uniref:Carbonic anhydrase n=1 Tax=Methylobacterium nodulans (strain LMG 21967 / CNCM I-2342 / ORS 2060) TaxID=460265 RepID=B8IF62_METNO|nr:gamma carbonic anhydrase family protein [Methylobacterium nodulans]ACL55773.1 carbonic anhydrase [Methylobacterium nodulans ORS 2060]